MSRSFDEPDGMWSRASIILVRASRRTGGRPVDLILLLAISLGWAAGYIFISDARTLPPITATAAMTAIAAAVVAPGVRLGLRRRLLPVLMKRPWVPAVTGLTGIAVPNLSVVAAEHAVPPALAAVLGTTVPISTVLLTMFVTRERTYSTITLLGVAVALAGLVVFVGGISALAIDTAELDGALVMMGGGLVFAANGIFAARQAQDLEPAALAVWTIVFGAVALAAAAFVLEEPRLAEVAGGILPLLGEGVIGMGFAYLGYFVLLSRAGASFTSTYAFLVPVLGVLGTALAYGRPVMPEHAAGLALVLIGLGLVVRR